MLPIRCNVSHAAIGAAQPWVGVAVAELDGVTVGVPVVGGVPVGETDDDEEEDGVFDGEEDEEAVPEGVRAALDDGVGVREGVAPSDSVEVGVGELVGELVGVLDDVTVIEFVLAGVAGGGAYE